MINSNAVTAQGFVHVIGLGELAGVSHQEAETNSCEQSLQVGPPREPNQRWPVGPGASGFDSASEAAAYASARSPWFVDIF